MIRRLGFRSILLGAALALPLGCYEATPPPEGPQSLREVQVPADFTFATSKPVALTVAAESGAIGGEQGALEVARADGKVLYRGPITAGERLALNLAIPSKDERVEITLRANDKETKASVAVINGSANQLFR